MEEEWPQVWGACAICGVAVGSPGWLVWDRAQKMGYFACGRHVRAVKGRNPGGTIEEV